MIKLKTILKEATHIHPAQPLEELTDKEIKFWALHADIHKELNTPNYKKVYKKLSKTLKGDRLDALNYFWDEYFSKL